MDNTIMYTDDGIIFSNEKITELESKLRQPDFENIGIKISTD